MLAVILLLGGCATDDHARFSTTPRDAVLQPKAYLGHQVRWGGVVMALEHRGGVSWLEVLAYPLTRKGEPILTAPSQGRFQVRADRFLEPLDFPKGRAVTIIGEVVALRSGLLGQSPVRFPLLEMRRYALWDSPPRGSAPDLHFGINIGFGF